MRDGEWQLRYGDTSVTFGPADLPIVNMSAPDLGDVSPTTEDADRPRSDGRAFGVDYVGGRTITFDLGIVMPDEAAARAVLADLRRAWRADPIRLAPGAVAELAVRYAGRERVVFGRPRRFAWSEEDVRDGFIAVTCDFAAEDDLWYSAQEHAYTFGIAPPLGGGLMAPLAAPLTSTASSDRSASITVGGELPAWPAVTVRGPITNPVVEIVGLWRLELRTTLAADQFVTIDTRPGARTILRNNGGSLGGALSRTSVRLARAAIPPGTYEVVLRGTDATGTASMTLTWRETYSTP